MSEVNTLDLITPEVLSLIKAGIGGNYGGKYYEAKMEEVYEPLKASLEERIKSPRVSDKDCKRLINVLNTLCKLDEFEVYTRDPWDYTFKEARFLLKKLELGESGYV